VTRQHKTQETTRLCSCKHFALFFEQIRFFLKPQKDLVAIHSLPAHARVDEKDLVAIQEHRRVVSVELGESLLERPHDKEGGRRPWSNFGESLLERPHYARRDRLPIFFLRLATYERAASASVSPPALFRPATT
jgi:hypothetical protein